MIFNNEINENTYISASFSDLLNYHNWCKFDGLYYHIGLLNSAKLNLSTKIYANLVGDKEIFMCNNYHKLNLFLLLYHKLDFFLRRVILHTFFRENLIKLYFWIFMITGLAKIKSDGKMGFL